MMRTSQKSGSGVIRWKDGNKHGVKHGDKQWIHAADTLIRGWLVYTVRFMGMCEVDRPKGTETVKEAIRKMKMRYTVKSDGGKPEKVELVISVDGLGVYDLKSKTILHHYPLHRISYCADDKSDKKMFTFIARDGDSDEHRCYVFSSEKCAEEIALTVGQAFDQAHQKFLEGYGKEAELRRHVLTLQHRINDIDAENKLLKLRVKELEKEQERPDLQQYLRPKTETRKSRPVTIAFGLADFAATNGHGRDSQNGDVTRGSDDVRPRSTSTNSYSGGSSGLISPPPRNPRSGQLHSQPIASPVTPGQPIASPVTPGQPMKDEDLFKDESDPFGMGAFQQQRPNFDLLEMQNAFSRGLDLGSDDFCLEDLDPLSSKA